ncbi:MAG TPA: hypothetical protein VFP11_05570 [Candidatus Angelobacter sp.]|nr:hypothetical protein [Candidatus Angelobacter sp.]
MVARLRHIAERGHARLSGITDLNGVLALALRQCIVRERSQRTDNEAKSGAKSWRDNRKNHTFIDACGRFDLRGRIAPAQQQ